MPEVAPRFWHLRPGTTFLGLGVPVPQTLGALALQTRAPGWLGGSAGDGLDVWDGLLWRSFYFDPATGRWQLDPDASVQDGFLLPAATPVLIHRLAPAATPNDSLLPLPLPYPH